MTHRHRPTTFLLALLALLSCGVAGGAETAGKKTAKKTQKEVRYAAVLMDGHKTGYGRSERAVADGLVTHTSFMSFEFKRSSVALKVKMTISTTETLDGKPVAFACKQDMGLMAMSVKGTIKDGQMLIETVSGGQTRRQTKPWPTGALMTEALDLLLRKKGLKEGVTFSAKVFDPSTMRALDANVVVGGVREVDLLGRVVSLTEVKTTMGTMLGKVTETSYVDKEFHALKTVTPMMGMTLEVLDCSKAYALSPNDPPEFFNRGLLDSPAPLPGIAGAARGVYHLTPKAGAKKLSVPGLDGQAVRKQADGTLVVTVTRQPAGTFVVPYVGKDKALRTALQPTRVLQSDHKLVRQLARQAVGDTKDAAKAARKIQAFVHRYVRKKDLSVGYATAAEVAQSRQGDCSEHAVLAAAMCRAVGLPAEVVVGMAYIDAFGSRKHIFGPHAWFRVWLGKAWVPMDAALPTGWDVGHIALATGDGDTGDFFQLVNTLGYFTITKAKVSK